MGGGAGEVRWCCGSEILVFMRNENLVPLQGEWRCRAKRRHGVRGGDAHPELVGPIAPFLFSPTNS